jgi:hypothetical protein
MSSSSGFTSKRPSTISARTASSPRSSSASSASSRIPTRDERGQRLDHALHLRLGDPAEERQRDRAAADVLTDRELALAPAEALAVEAHQVDRGQVRLRLDALLGEPADRPVAIDASRQLDDVYEP